MNLKACFNFNFFKENVRKSKGLLAFLLGVIPIINIIYLIVLLTNSSNHLLDFNLLSFLTYAGLIFIPIGLSITLFGFVFKKRSVDFVISKPISRRSIFITNTLGGIFVLFVFMLLNTLIFGLFGLIFPSLTIPFALLIDYFLFWFVSYIFVFITANLAVVLTGNIITSFVMLAIILFFAPYINVISYLSHDYYSRDNYIVCNTQECMPDNYYCYDDSSCESHLANHEYQLNYGKLFSYNFVAPLSMANNSSTFYNTISLIKMLILSVVYAFAGYFIFKKRKMENNETSFKSNFAHYLVKGITLFPVCFITYVILRETDFIGFLVSIVGIIIYSIVYDLITRREIYKPFKSFVFSFVLFLLFTGFYYLDFEVIEQKEQVLKDVDSITYEGMNITDKDTQNKIIKAVLENKPTQINYSYDFLFKVDGTTYKVTADVNENTDAFLKSELQKYNLDKIKNFNINSVQYMEYNGTSIPVTKKIKSLIKDNLDKIDDFDLNTMDRESLLYLYNYHHHEYEKIYIPIQLSEELYQEVLTYQNNLFINYLDEHQGNLYFDLFDNDADVFTEEDYFVFNYVINSNLKEFLQYLKTDNDMDMNQDMAYIQVYIMNKDYRFTIGNIQKFKEKFDKFKENVQENAEYQSLLHDYQEMVDIGVYY